ncbi:MAG: hypothetical protein ACUVRG_10535 [Ignavibacterium sp.]
MELNLQYVERNDDKPLCVENKTDAKTCGAFAELIYRPEGDASK